MKQPLIFLILKRGSFFVIIITFSEIISTDLISSQKPENNYVLTVFAGLTLHVSHCSLQSMWFIAWLLDMSSIKMPSSVSLTITLCNAGYVGVRCACCRVPGSREVWSSWFGRKLCWYRCCREDVQLQKGHSTQPGGLHARHYCELLSVDHFCSMCVCIRCIAQSCLRRNHVFSLDLKCGLFAYACALDSFPVSKNIAAGSHFCC